MGGKNNFRYNAAAGLDLVKRAGQWLPTAEAQLLVSQIRSEAEQLDSRDILSEANQRAYRRLVMMLARDKRDDLRCSRLDRRFPADVMQDPIFHQ